MVYGFPKGRCLIIAADRSAFGCCRVSYWILFDSNIVVPENAKGGRAWKPQVKQMEIIVFPYMAVSFAIAWGIFSPFAQIEDLHDWTFAKIQTSDLFAIFLPFSFLLGAISWTSSTSTVPTVAWSLIAAAIFLLSLFGLVAGLFLLAKMNRIPPHKRTIMIGVVIPVGTLLTLAWIALPIFASLGSILFAIPATIAVVPVTLALRVLSCWVCKTSSPTCDSALIDTD